MGPSSQRFKQWPSPFRRGSSPCSASAPSSWSLRWIRPEREAACFPTAEAGGLLPGRPPRASGRSLSGHLRCRLGQLVGFNPKGLLGAVASVRGLGRRCRRPLAASGTGGRRIPHGPACPRLRPAVRRPVVRTAFSAFNGPFRCASLCPGLLGCRDFPTPQPR